MIYEPAFEEIFEPNGVKDEDKYEGKDCTIF
jgi:hypothetical protein